MRDRHVDCSSTPMRVDGFVVAAQQGLVVLGAPLGSDAFVQHELRRKRGLHDELLSHFPGLPDLQGAWLLLLFCASPRANYLLRMLPPGVTVNSPEATTQPCKRASRRCCPKAKSSLSRRSGRSSYPCVSAALGCGRLQLLPPLPTGHHGPIPCCARAPQAVERLLQGLRDDGQAVAAPLAAARHAAQHECGG